MVIGMLRLLMLCLRLRLSSLMLRNVLLLRLLVLLLVVILRVCCLVPLLSLRVRLMCLSVLSVFVVRFLRVYACIMTRNGGRFRARDSGVFFYPSRRPVYD